IRIEAIEIAGWVALVVVHRAGPEAAERVDLAVVEAVIGQMRLGIDDRSDRAGVEIDGAKTILESADQAAALAQADRADTLGHRPAVQGAAAEVERVDRGLLDVDPVQ